MKKILLLTAALAMISLLASSCGNQSVLRKSLKENEMKAVQFRIARPTNNLKEVVKFYQEALGLIVLGKFENHKGYDGVMLGMPDKTYHLEFTQHEDKTPLPQPTKENLLVFYYDTEDAYRDAIQRIKKNGAKPVEPENPYWKNKSETYEDPDGWRVILFNGVYNPS